jgi:hypothetical protein
MAECLIDEVFLEPAGDQLRILLKGNLAGMLRVAQENKRPSETDDLSDQYCCCGGSAPVRFLRGSTGPP